MQSFANEIEQNKAVIKIREFSYLFDYKKISHWIYRALWNNLVNLLKIFI